MIWCYPPFPVAGWHVEIGWSWETFGLIVSITWGASVTIRLGFGYVMVWCFDDAL